MTAAEARVITQRSLERKKADISRFVYCIDRAISAVANEGENSLDVGLRLAEFKPLTDEEKKLLKEHYISNGFDWKDKSTDTKPANPILSW